MEAFLFDIGNVLLRFDFAPAYEAIASQSDLVGGQAVEFALEPLKTVYEAGGMRRDEFLRRSIELVGYRGSAAKFQAVWEDIFSVNAPMEAVVRALSGNYPLFLLSNTNCMHVESIFKRYAFFGLFQGGVYSHEVRVSKPEPGIFRIAMERFRLRPGRTLFVDDLGPNIEAARQLGFGTHHYRANAHGVFLGALGRLGVAGVARGGGGEVDLSLGPSGMRGFRGRRGF